MLFHIYHPFMQEPITFLCTYKFHDFTSEEDTFDKFHILTRHVCCFHCCVSLSIMTPIKQHDSFTCSHSLRLTIIRSCMELLELSALCRNLDTPRAWHISFPVFLATTCIPSTSGKCATVNLQKKIYCTVRPNRCLFSTNSCVGLNPKLLRQTVQPDIGTPVCRL